MTNMTYAVAIDVALEALGASNPEATERLTALKNQLAKRGSKGGMTKTQKANEVIKTMILEILSEAEAFIPMAEILADSRMPEGMSPQKCGALLGQLVKADEVVKHIYKKRTFYALTGTEFVAPDAEANEGEDA
jgi:delta-aminolevulinic acid dehydratase/porphobilinogen synthase